MKIDRLLFGLAVLFMFILSCSRPQQDEGKTAKKTVGTIKIGLQGPMTGEFALEGQGFKKVIEMLVDEKNKAGGVLGKKIELILQDDRGDPQEASNAAAKIVDQKAIAIIGSYNSGASEPASKIYAEKNILQVIPSSTATRITTKGYTMLFRVCFLDDRQGLFASEFITKDLGAKKVAIIHDNSTYAKGLADWTKKYIEEHGGKVIFFDAIDPKGQDFKPVLTKMKKENPDAVFFTGYYGQGGLLIKQMRDLGIKIPFIAGNAVNNPEFIKIAGLESAKGAFVVSEPLPQDLKYDKARRLMAGFKGKYNADPQSVWTIMAADAFDLVIKAIEDTKSEDPKVLAEYLHKLKDYDGYTGKIQGFDDKGDRLGTVHVAYIVDDTGKFVMYERKTDATKKDDTKEIKVEPVVNEGTKK